MTTLALSIVSHGQGELVKQLLSDLARLDFSQFEKVEIIVTLNIPENESFLDEFVAEILILRNPRPQGFGANHNQAFAATNADFFIVLNPDIRVKDSFAEYIIQASHKHWGCMAPLVYSPAGKLEDSARFYPSVFRISKRVLLNNRDSDYKVVSTRTCMRVDWVAGIFLVFHSDTYRVLQGFDDRYFMYLEDADICRRSNRLGLPVLLNPNFSIVHDARRSSFKNSNHLRWHLRSMIRFIFGL